MEGRGEYEYLKPNQRTYEDTQTMISDEKHTHKTQVIKKNNNTTCDEDKIHLLIRYLTPLRVVYPKTSPQLSS